MGAGDDKPDVAGTAHDPLRDNHPLLVHEKRKGGRKDLIPAGQVEAILGDTGEGDTSQYALLPLLHAANPDLIIINGDVAYPAGELDDFVEGFFRPYTGFGIPIWATAGNHEYYSGVDEWCDHVASLGMRVLRNERVTVGADLEVQ